MAAFAPPVSRDGFVYHAVFFADVGNLNRHPRASVAELTELLRPKIGQKSTAPKDQVAHWYEAQLLHYGLPRVKDKNASKVRLLNAINAGTLKVPDTVKKLEASLKREWDAANKKARAAEKKAQDQPTPQKKSTSSRKVDAQDQAAGPIKKIKQTASSKSKANEEPRETANRTTANIAGSGATSTAYRPKNTARKSLANSAPRTKIPPKKASTSKDGTVKKNMTTTKSPSRLNNKGGVQKPKASKPGLTKPKSQPATKTAQPKQKASRGGHSGSLDREHPGVSVQYANREASDEADETYERATAEVKSEVRVKDESHEERWLSPAGDEEFNGCENSDVDMEDYISDEEADDSTEEEQRDYEHCFRCGREGHWARDCPDRDQCFRCGGFGHWASECGDY